MRNRSIDLLGTRKATDQIGLDSKVGLDQTSVDHTDQLPMTSSLTVGRRGSLESCTSYISSYKDPVTVIAAPQQA